MVSMISGISILVGVVIAVQLLANLLRSGKGGNFIQAELFTSVISVFFVGIITFAAAIFWTGVHVFLNNLIADTLVTLAVFIGVAVFAVIIGRTRSPKIVSSSN